MLKITEETIDKCYAKYGKTFRIRLADAIIDSNFRGKIPNTVAEELSSYLKTDIKGLMKELLCIAKTFARALISNCYIGSIAKDSVENLYLGANIEFPGGELGYTVHAEVSAILNAFANSAESIDMIAVDNVPCGDCRQFIRELINANDLEIMISNRPSVSMKDLLPISFSPEELGNSSGFFAKENHHLTIGTQYTVNALAKSALDAANRSYAPYTKHFAAAAIQANDGRIYAAPYVENVAFNPSYTPMRSALNYFNVSNRTYDEIENVVLVEHSIDGKSWFEHSSADLLSLVNPNVRLKIIKLDIQ